MKYRAILFDMDGTLLPMDLQAFTKGYFKMLYARLAKFGLEAGSFARNMWAGVEAMVRNDGGMTNEDAFWQVFSKLAGVRREVVDPECIDFYGGAFQNAKCFTGENPLAVEAIRTAREKAEFVVLATNPLFPMVGQQTRMGWVGLKPTDFDLVTSYEGERFCKPNPKYYTSICDRLGVRPEECLMIGNDEGEDMYAGTMAGLDCYLVTDCRIPDEKHPWTGAKGTFPQMLEMLKALE